MAPTPYSTIIRIHTPLLLFPISDLRLSSFFLSCPQQPTVLGAGYNKGKLRVKANCGDIVCVAFQGLNTRLVLVIPHFNKTIICTTNEVGLVATLERERGVLMM